MNKIDIVEHIRKKCQEEIEWVYGCMKEIEQGVEYTKEDVYGLPYWADAHKYMLDTIEKWSRGKNNETNN